jgi:two-component system nitrate/nitrite response regulator NarL
MDDFIPTSRRLSWLTPRERNVLTHLVAGRTVEEIAAADFVAVTTVRSHVRGILTKLGVSSQLAAVVAVYGQVVDPPAILHLLEQAS